MPDVTIQKFEHRSPHSGIKTELESLQYVKSLVDGDSPAARRTQIQVAAATGAPTTITGHTQCSGAQSVNIYWKETAGGTLDIELWLFFRTPGIWIKDDNFGKVSITASEAGGRNIDTKGVDYLTLETSNHSVAPVGTLDVWCDRYPK